ncbi:MAG TPA: molybdopterin oxidoreductase family protein [Verrucomicrobiales bacterium]|nr:molybdopterin oxidoreductase family protein [Verrucomicrobiales bacterium]
MTARTFVDGLPPLRAWDGVLTRELVRQPGKFGLGSLPAALQLDATASLVCGFCSTGCGLKAHLADGEALNLTPDTGYPVNLGMACPKGWEALAPLRAADRAIEPLWRRERGGPTAPLDWETAAGIFVHRFKALREAYGGDSLAFLSTGQICSEEMALLGCLARFGFLFGHGDGNTRQCMATAAAAYKESFGFDAPPYTYADFEESDVLVFIGANPCIAHPIMWQRVLRNPHRPEIVVIDPRRTETAMAATQHYPIAPKSDLVFLYGLAARLLKRGAIDRDFVNAHTLGFDQFRAHVANFSPDRVCRRTGVSEAGLERLAATVAAGRRVSFWWTMGVNQGAEATRTAQAIINLALMTGNIGRPGTGANSITGQCNAMGSRLFSNTASLIGGHDFTDCGHRRKVAEVLGIDPSLIPAENCLAYDQIIDGIDSGRIRGLWIIATNPAHSWIQRGRLDRLLGKLDFLVVQDMYSSTETARAADLILPAAAWGEKEGTFINSERRIGLIKRVARPPGQALSDFTLFRLLAHAWGEGCAEMFSRWISPEAAFEIMKELTRGRPCDITGVNGYRMLDDEGGVQWPLPAGEKLESAHRRLFADGRFHHPDGRARFRYSDPAGAQPENPDAEYPLALLTGRGTSAQWHTQTRTAKSGVLRRLYPEGAYLEIHPEDAKRFGIGPGERVRVVSRRAAVEATAFVTPGVGLGQVFLPMHYSETNLLTRNDVDPHSRQPNYKYCAVRVEGVGGRRG